MIEPRKDDSKIVAHARRELEMAGLFNTQDDYDGFIGKGALALIKLFDRWTDDDPAKMQVLQSMFNYLMVGDLLSPPTNDPDEWEDVPVEDQMVTRNKRNNMYITRDGRKTWFNLRTQQAGICNDFKTGKPLEGVRDPNGKTKVSEDQEGATDAGDSGDGGHSNQSESGQAADPVEATESRGEDAKPVEGGELDAGVEPKGKTNTAKAKAPKKKPQTGEK